MGTRVPICPSLIQSLEVLQFKESFHYLSCKLFLNHLYLPIKERVVRKIWNKLLEVLKILSELASLNNLTEPSKNQADSSWVTTRFCRKVENPIFKLQSFETGFFLKFFKRAVTSFDKILWLNPCTFQGENFFSVYNL